MASIRRVGALSPIEGISKFALASVSGWTAFVPPDVFSVGDRVVFVEIDSWIPESCSLFASYPLRGKWVRAKTMQGRKGWRVVTHKIREALCQGVVLPLPDDMKDLPDGEDVSRRLGVVKYDPDTAKTVRLMGEVQGPLPSFLQKTNQERCQNLAPKIWGPWKDHAFEVTLKLDGMSMTCFCHEGEVGVCSHKCRLKAMPDNAFWATARAQRWPEALRTLCESQGRNLALQAELMGERIQKNRDGLVGNRAFVFDVYDIDLARYLLPDERLTVVRELERLGADVPHVPVLDAHKTLEDLPTVEALLAFATGPGMSSPLREGVVFKSTTDSAVSFKAISNEYLLADKALKRD